MVEPRFLNVQEAARWAGVCESVFLEEVRSGVWPPARRRGAIP
jgi:hypothetical protein